ncbi:MAG: carboxypeptidase M32, partial [Burkholderiales bacterium]|nr:carboxypeptidase M32 [Burkholderiales bacterium]
MTTESTAYQALRAAFARIHRYEHLQGIVSWDQAAYMPPAANEARAAALAELAALLHRLRTEPKIGQLLAQAEDEPLDEVQRANLREIRRHWLLATAWPEDLVE